MKESLNLCLYCFRQFCHNKYKVCSAWILEDMIVYPSVHMRNNIYLLGADFDHSN